MLSQVTPKTHTEEATARGLVQPDLDRLKTLKI
jgi:hypothetical protein